MSNDNIIPLCVEKLIYHILIVEDDVSLRFTLAEWLRSLNYVVYEASNADEAVIILASPMTVDFVVTDVDMPGTMNGFGLVSHIRRALPGMGIIVVSGNAVEQEAIENGVPFFRKPYDFENISLLIRMQIQNNPVKIS